MDSALTIHRLHFAFTITYHYLFPQLTMGLAPLIVILKSLALWKGNDRYNQAARFWGKIFAINFLFRVITGIPMEFQFGTNWARFAQYSGGVIATSLAMEGVFAFFLESSFLGIFLFGEKRFGQRIHWLAGFMIFLGSWLSAFFIIVTDAWMQHPAMPMRRLRVLKVRIDELKGTRETHTQPSSIYSGCRKLNRRYIEPEEIWRILRSEGCETLERKLIALQRENNVPLDNPAPILQQIDEMRFWLPTGTLCTET